MACRRLLLTAVTLSALTGFSIAPATASAAGPEPANASILSATATILPIAVGGSLLLTGRRDSEGVRLASAFTTMGIGAAVGPSIGQFYAGGGVDAVVTLLLRSLTTGMTATGGLLALRGGPDEEPTAIALMVVGGLTTVALAVFDIVDAADTARESKIRSASLDPELRELMEIAQCGPFPCSTRVASETFEGVEGQLAGTVLSEARAP